MQIRPATVTDLDALNEIDGTVESTQYLHITREGEPPALTWKIDERKLTARLIAPNPLNDEKRFTVGQITSGADEGVVLIAEHEGQAIGLLVAQSRPVRGTMKLLDLRVDFDQRRQGFASAMMFQLIQSTRESGLRAVAAETRANHSPANQLLAKLGFELTGLDLQRNSTHDLVKESVTLFWHLPLD